MADFNKPKIVKIGIFKYDIKYHDKLESDKKDEEYYGEHDTFKMELRISERFEPIRQKASIIHESLHAIDDHNGLDLSEDQVISLANNLIMYMRDNKDIIRYILSN